MCVFSLVQNLVTLRLYKKMQRHSTHHMKTILIENRNCHLIVVTMLYRSKSYRKSEREFCTILSTASSKPFSNVELNQSIVQRCNQIPESELKSLNASARRDILRCCRPLETQQGTETSFSSIQIAQQFTGGLFKKKLKLILTVTNKDNFECTYEIKPLVSNQQVWI